MSVSECERERHTLLVVAGGGAPVAAGVPLGVGTTGAPSAVWEGVAGSFSIRVEVLRPDWD